jgi:hypothetical protein
MVNFVLNLKVEFWWKFTSGVGAMNMLFIAPFCGRRKTEAVVS